MEGTKKIEKLIRDLLEEIGENMDREGLLKTPKRVARSWEFFSRGRTTYFEPVSRWP